MKISLTTKIFIGLIAGILLGYFVPSWGIAVRPLSTLFLNLIKSIIAPLIFSTLVIGIAGTGDIRQVGRIGVKALVYFEIVTTFALVIGLAAVNLTKPGVGVSLAGVHKEENKAVLADRAQALAREANAAAARGDAATAAAKASQAADAASRGLKSPEPPANTVGQSGLGVLNSLGMLVGTLYGALIVFIVFVLLPIALMARVPLRDVFNAVKEPATIAFATTSSESALPKAMENMERLGVPRRIVGFVLPTGYSFNLDGTTLYLSLASIFVAQAAGVHLTLAQQVVMLLTLMLTSKGVAGVPRASLVILLGTLASFNLPAEGVIVILGVDELMDMARTCVNVIGNCLATVVIARSENAFRTNEWVLEEAELEQVTGLPAIAT